MLVRRYTISCSKTWLLHFSVLSRQGSGDAASVVCDGERDFGTEAKDLLSAVEVIQCESLPNKIIISSFTL